MMDEKYSTKIKPRLGFYFKTTMMVLKNGFLQKIGPLGE
jgi:hypothetical protein